MGFYDSGNFQINTGVVINGNNNTVNNSSSGIRNECNVNQGLTQEEWDTLNWFFIECQSMFTKQTEQYRACTEILHNIEKRDAPSLKNVLKEIGRSVLSGIVSTGAGAAVGNAAGIILDKICMW